MNIKLSKFRNIILITGINIILLSPLNALEKFSYRMKVMGENLQGSVEDEYTYNVNFDASNGYFR